MLDKLISNYINKLSVNDILSFASKNNIILSNNEANIIYNYIVENWYILLHNNPTPIFNKLKKEISNDTYNICIKLYNEYHQKYSNYL